MPASGRSGRDEFLAAHIPGARFLDIDEVSDKSESRAAHAAERGRFRRGDGAARRRPRRPHRRLRQFADRAPRRAAGSCCATSAPSKVAILDGGFQKWLAEGRPTESGEPAPRAASFDAASERDEVVTKQQLLAGAGLPLVDARGRPRFEGSEPDPRPGVAAGPYPRRAQPAVRRRSIARTGRFKPLEELRRLFAEAGVDPARPFVASCGSGVTANSLIFAAHLLGNDETQALRRQLERMGRRSGDAEGDWVRPRRGRSRRRRASSRRICVDQRLARRARAARGPAWRSAEQRFDPRRGGADQPARAAVEPALLRFAGVVPAPRRSLVVVEVRRRARRRTASTRRSAWRTLASRDTASA